MITLAQAKSELITAQFCRERWVDMYRITGKTKYVAFSRKALHTVRRFRRIVNEIEQMVLIAQ